MARYDLREPPSLHDCAQIMGFTAFSAAQQRRLEFTDCLHCAAVAVQKNDRDVV